MMTSRRYYLHGDLKEASDTSYYCSFCDKWEPLEEILAHEANMDKFLKTEQNWFRIQKLNYSKWQRDVFALNLFDTFDQALSLKIHP
jgi:hypothetical protein